MLIVYAIGSSRSGNYLFAHCLVCLTIQQFITLLVIWTSNTYISSDYCLLCIHENYKYFWDELFNVLFFQMVVTIIGGVPGSHKNDLCTSLTRLAKEDSRWAVLKQPIESTDIFTAENLQTSIATTWRAQRRRKPGQSAKKMRAIVVTSG